MLPARILRQKEWPPPEAPGKLLVGICFIICAVSWYNGFGSEEPMARMGETSKASAVGGGSLGLHDHSHMRLALTLAVGDGVEKEVD